MQVMHIFHIILNNTLISIIQNFLNFSIKCFLFNILCKKHVDVVFEII